MRVEEEGCSKDPAEELGIRSGTASGGAEGKVNLCFPGKSVDCVL